MSYQRFVFLLVLCAIHPWESGCVIEDLQDIIDVTYNFGEYLLGCCVHQSQSEPTTHNQIELPWLRDKQKKVMSQIKVLSQDIDHMEDKVSRFYRNSI